MKRFYPVALVFLFVVAYLYPRLNNLKNNLEFRSDQGIHLLETKEMVDSHHLRLIGPTTSKTYNGRQFYTGAIYYYFLAILGSIFAWSPLSITVALIVFECIFYSVFIIYLQRNFGYLLSIFISLVISISPYLIFHSYFFWNPHFLIPLSILFIIYRKNSYLSALFFGLAFSFHYSAIFWLIPYLYFRFHYHQLKPKIIIFALFCFIIANLPIIVFEFRHQFYNLKTIFLVACNSQGVTGLTPHYFIFPFLILLIFYISYLSRKSHLPLFLLLIMFLFLKDNAQKKRSFLINYPTQLKISSEISKLCPPNYNIASTNQGDTRSYDLRYLLLLKSCPPLSVNDYPQSKTLFLIAPLDRSLEQEKVWELDSFKPFKVTSSQNISEKVVFYRLDK